MATYACPHLRGWVELTEERKKHILTYHPDLGPFFDRLEDVLLDPDEIRRSVYDKEAVLFYKFFADVRSGKFIAVVVKRNKRNFILTSHLTREG